MKFFTAAASFLLLGLARFSAAADSLPECGLLCIADLTLQSSCSLTNITCICTNTELNLAITECVSQNCTIRESLTVEKYSKGQCGVVPRDRTKLVSIVGVTFGVLAVVAFGFRIISKATRHGGTFGLDDYAMIVAVCLVILLSVFSVLLATHGLGQDVWNISFENITYVSYIFFWDELVYLAALPITKISILLFYLRIFPRRGFKYCVYVLIAANVGYLISFEVISIWQCRPIDAAWKKWDGTVKAQCNNINLQSWLSAAFNIVLDLGMFLLPMPELYKLSMSPKKKLHIMLMFSVGLFVTIISCLRLHFLLAFGNTTNLTQDYVDLGVWSTIEVPMGIICACMPSIRSLFRNVFPAVFSSTNREASVASSMPKIQKITNQGSNGRFKMSNKPKLEGGDSFVQLVDLDSRDGSNGSKVGYTV